YFNMQFLKELISISGASSDESRIKDFILNYIEKNASSWLSKPEVIEGDMFQDAFILVFGKPKTAIIAHIDTIGFSVAYDNELYKIGGPQAKDGYELVGEDSHGKIEAELMVIEDEDGGRQLKAIFEREIERGTILTFKPNFRETDDFIQS